MKTLIVILGMTLVSMFGISMANAAEYRTFTVSDGEDLSAFSKRLYGTTTKWKEIADLNKDTLPDANAVHAGMTLKVKVNSKLRERMGSQGTPVAVTETASAVTVEDVPNTSLQSQIAPTPVANAAAPATAPAMTPSGETSAPAPVYRSPASMNAYVGPSDVARGTYATGEPRPVPSDRAPASEVQRLEPKKPKTLDGFKHYEVALAEQNASKAVVKDNTSAPASESNGYATLMYGMSLASGNMQFVNFGVDAGYRFFSSVPSLSLGIQAMYYSQGTAIKGMAFYANPTWFFNDTNDGLSVALGLGYAMRTTGGSGGAISFMPQVQYDFAITPVFSIGLEAALQYSMFSGTPDTNIYTLAALKYWF